ncbi:uncharacterized protein [Drosophila tropicalis]|uniref:uncharacterized protein n=1 Tax=Drosophila tropicalis TaxID=46794 RepID=UPI0035ABD9FC
MSNPNTEITSGSLEPCGSTLMALERIDSEPLKSSFTSCKTPLTNNMDIQYKAINNLLQIPESVGPEAPQTDSAYNVIRLHLRRRQPAERITAGADVKRSLEETPRQADSIEIKHHNKFSSKPPKILEMPSRRSHSKSPKMRQAVSNPRRAVTQPRRTNSNLDLPTVAVDNLLPTVDTVSAPPQILSAQAEFIEEMANCSSFSSSACSSSINECWLDSHSYGAGHSQSAGTLQLAKKRRNSMTYDEWLTHKRKQAYQHQRQRRRDAHRLAAAEEVRKQMSEKCYTEWLASKQRANRQHKASYSGNQLRGSLVSADINHYQYLPHMQVMAGARPWSPRTLSSCRTSTEARESRVQQWQRNKAIEEDRLRSLKRREQSDRDAEIEERRRLSQMAWDRWLIQVSGKSPVNRSLNSTAKKPTHRSNDQVETLPNAGSRLTTLARKRRHGIPPSIAQRALRQRLNNMDGIQMHRSRK